MIGAWNSFCSYLQIPVANQAPQGPLAMISPANTYLGAHAPYGPASDLEALYPSGERNFVRIAAADHLLAVAEVELAKELGAKSVFLLGDSLRYAPDARKAARNLGLDVAGAASWNYEARDFAPLARRIARSRPDAVAIFGVYERNEGELLRDLRAALGPDVPLIANDGFMVPEGLVKAAGPAARGMYLGFYGVPNGELPPAGERFLEEFEAARGGGPTPWYSATYGAQAAEILLDAIARSDGTRASVNTELRRTIVEDGILGDIRFDENGDLVEGPVSFFRAVGPRQPSSTMPGGPRGLRLRSGDHGPRRAPGVKLGSTGRRDSLGCAHGLRDRARPRGGRGREAVLRSRAHARGRGGAAPPPPPRAGTGEGLGRGLGEPDGRGHPRDRSGGPPPPARRPRHPRAARRAEPDRRRLLRQAQGGRRPAAPLRPRRGARSRR